VSGGTGTINAVGSDLAVGGDGAGYTSFNWVSPPISATSWSSVVFLTSNLGPVYRSGKVKDGGLSDGDLPAAEVHQQPPPVPEPSGILLAVIGTVGCGFLRRRRPSAA
jgi:hypothetical protein